MALHHQNCHHPPGPSLDQTSKIAFWDHLKRMSTVMFPGNKIFLLTFVHISNISTVRDNIQKKSSTFSNRREGGQPNFKKMKISDFLTKIIEEGGYKTYYQKQKHSILYDSFLNLAKPRNSMRIMSLNILFFFDVTPY